MWVAMEIEAYSALELRRIDIISFFRLMTLAEKRQKERLKSMKGSNSSNANHVPRSKSTT